MWINPSLGKRDRYRSHKLQGTDLFVVTDIVGLGLKHSESSVANGEGSAPHLFSESILLKNIMIFRQSCIARLFHETLFHHFLFILKE